ncbi:MAG: hypothetical protein F6K28_52090 [Microcoleus sp. SIO2G3]|nr:hypothetical protein [Microcoleus sp. SIO2G3]
MGNTASSRFFPLMNSLRWGIWLVGMLSWIFGIADRTIAAFADSHLAASELLQLSVASLLALGWFSLKPKR